MPGQDTSAGTRPRAQPGPSPLCHGEVITEADWEAATQYWIDTACLHGTRDEKLALAFARHRRRALEAHK